MDLKLNVCNFSRGEKVQQGPVGNDVILNKDFPNPVEFTSEADSCEILVRRDYIFSP